MFQNKAILLSFVCIGAILLSSCGGPLSKEQAGTILHQAYTGSYNPDEAGGSHTVIDNLTIDSIRQEGSTAHVFYRLSGRVENGSKYPQELDGKEHADEFHRGIFGGWKEK